MNDRVDEGDHVRHARPFTDVAEGVAAAAAEAHIAEGVGEFVAEGAGETLRDLGEGGVQP